MPQGEITTSCAGINNDWQWCCTHGNRERWSCVMSFLTVHSDKLCIRKKSPEYKRLSMTHRTTPCSRTGSVSHSLLYTSQSQHLTNSYVLCDHCLIFFIFWSSRHVRHSPYLRLIWHHLCHRQISGWKKKLPGILHPAFFSFRKRRKSSGNHDRDHEIVDHIIATVFR